MYSKPYIVREKKSSRLVAVFFYLIAAILALNEADKPYAGIENFVIVSGLIVFFLGAGLYISYFCRARYIKVIEPYQSYIIKHFKKKRKVSIDEIGDVYVVPSPKYKKLYDVWVYDFSQEFLGVFNTSMKNCNAFINEMNAFQKVKVKAHHIKVGHDQRDEFVDEEEYEKYVKEVERNKEEEELRDNPEKHYDERKRKIRILKVISLILSIGLGVWMYESPGLKSLSIRFIIYWCVNLLFDFVCRNTYVFLEDKKRFSSDYINYLYRTVPYIVVLWSFRFDEIFKFEGGDNGYIYFILPLLIISLFALIVVFEKNKMGDRFVIVFLLLPFVFLISLYVKCCIPIIYTETISEEVCQYVSSHKSTGKETKDYLTVKDSTGKKYEFEVKEPTYNAIREKKAVPVICHHVDKYGVKVCHLKYYPKKSVKIENKAVLKKIDKTDCKK